MTFASSHLALHFVSTCKCIYICMYLGRYKQCPLNSPAVLQKQQAPKADLAEDEKAFRGRNHTEASTFPSR